VATFGQTSFAFAASQAAKITQEIRRKRREAPRVAVAEPLDDELARQQLEHRVAAHLPTPSGRLALAVTDNRFTMISVKRDKGPVYRVRVHHMFLEAPPTVARALARYIALNEREASRELGAFIEENQRIIRRNMRRRAAPVTLETAGEIYHLQEVFDELNRRYFDGRIDARITWGPRSRKRLRRTSIKMGSYSVEEKLIRIHPSLDRAFVPRYFLEWIVYHEMLHQVHDIPVVGGRRQFHTPEFLTQEREFEHYQQARLWERRNLDRILCF
jgi:predicted metal-dependent hydrolase